MFKQNRFVLILSVIFLVNFIFKLIYIADSPFWYDEIISVRDTLLDWGHIKHEAEWDKNPPFYHYILWLWSKVFGISEFGIRSMSAFFSAMTAVLIFVFSKKLANNFFAICSTIIFTFHPYLFYYAQEARCYSLLIFLIMINVMTLHSLIIKPSYLKCFALGVINFLIFYTHYIAGLILFFQFIYVSYLFRKNLLYIVIIYVTPILLVLLRFTKKQYQVLFFSSEMSRQKSNVPIANPGLLKLSIPPLYVSFLVLGLLILGGCYYFYKNRNILEKRDLSFKLFIAFSPIFCILSLYLLGTKTNVFNERYLIFTIPFIILSFFVFADNKIVLIGITIFILLLECLNIHFGEPKGMDYRICAHVATEIKKKNDVNVFLNTHDVVGLFMYYYDRNFFLSKKRESREELGKIGVFYLKDHNELWALDFSSKKDFIFFQTFQHLDDDLLIWQEFYRQGYKCYFNEVRPGVTISYWSSQR